MRIKWWSVVRISGLLFVLMYHFFKELFPGGFIGVDVLFVLSGFLTTALIIDRFDKKGTFDLREFYHKRFMRIVPPLVISMIIVLPFTLLIGKDYLAGIDRQIAAALSFMTNYFEILTGGSYENNFFPHLFIHTWSLALEAHFYLLWGAVLFFVIRSRENKAEERRLAKLRARIFLVSATLFLASLTVMYVRTGMKVDFSVIYFSDLSRSFSFFMGSMLATFTGVRAVPKKARGVAARWTAKTALIWMFVPWSLLLILSLVLTFDSPNTYWFGFLLAVIAAAVMIYAARVLHEKTPQDEPRVLTFLADISYNVYLYHWPLYVILDAELSNGLAVVLALVGSLFFASASFYVFEPLLRGEAVPFKLAYAKIPLALLGVGLLGVTGYLCWTASPITSLETKLWENHLLQDADSMQLTRQSAIKKAEFNVPKGVSIIGDSVTLGTREYLGQHVADSQIDAAGERQMDEALDVMQGQIEKNGLREYVVICIGTNSLDNYEELIAKVIKALPKGHRLIFMTPYDGRADATWNSSKVAVFERTLPEKYDYITIADWNLLAPQHPEAFVETDGVHFAGNPAGDKLYAECINQALKEAKEKPVKQ